MAYGTIDAVMKLRPAQLEILKYQGGRMAISAVPGSGKTFTLAMLAAQLIADGRINIRDDQQVLVVTYLNASVESFRASIRRRLTEQDLPAEGFDVRTLHSLALEVVRLSASGLGEDSSEPEVLDEAQSGRILALAVDGFIEAHPETWHAFLAEDTPQLRTRWRNITLNTAQAFIRTAKNERLYPESILAKMRRVGSGTELREDELTAAIRESPLLWMMASIYERYQAILTRQAAMDFDDLIWQAVELLERRPDLTAALQQRWPYVLEDEAQDSVPLQETLIGRLCGEKGNWVRVGDPNQAITSTFTAAHPRYFRAFIDQPDVVSRPLPNSGRCAPLIFGAANALVDWVIDKHPVPEVRQHAFRRQQILPTPADDAQPNPPDREADIRIRVYKHREDNEVPAVAQLATQYAAEHPTHTLAILVPTNQIGHHLASFLDGLKADYDNLLRGGGRVREIAAAMHAHLAVLASPLRNQTMADAYVNLVELQHPALPVLSDGSGRIQTLLQSVHRPESLLFPTSDGDVLTSLPAGVASEEEVAHIEQFASFMRRLFRLRALPVDDLALALGDELFAWGEVNDADLSMAYQIAAMMRRWRNTQPDWRLPELVAQLADVAEGRQRLPYLGPSGVGYEPQPGRITLATQHGAKGLEWDAVFLVGIDGFWIPGSLESTFLGVHDFLGGDPSAEVVAQLKHLMKGDAGLFGDLDPTESAHVEIICERLRLLYVGVTRARRYLHISRSRATRQYNSERDAEPATVLGVLYRYLKRRRE